MTTQSCGDNWLTFLTAPADVPLWCVYGHQFWPTMICCRIRDYPDGSRAMWGYSVYRRKPGFRTLGVGIEWADEHDCKFFVNQGDALAHIAMRTLPHPKVSE